MTVIEATELLDTLWDRFEASRSFFPYMPPHAVGALDRYTPPGWYRNTAPYKVVILQEAVTDGGRRRHNDLGYWVNQAFVISLWSTLLACGAASDSEQLDRGVDDWKHANLVRRLRHVFAKEAGRLVPGDSEHETLLTWIRDGYGESPGESGQYPLSIDTVLRPMFEGCRRYSVAVLSASDGDPQR